MSPRAAGNGATLRAVAIAVTLAAAAGGCATLPPCPARGGPAWRELSTEHFTVRTDLGEAEARDVATALEETRAAMLAAVWPNAPGPPDRVPVIALHSTHELSEFAGVDIGGEWVHHPPFSATIVMGGTSSAERLQTLRHELAHYLSFWFLPSQPLWFSEGIATFLETIHYDRQRHRAVVGEPSDDRYRELRLGLFPVDRLLTEAHPDAVDMGRFEASSWLLVHYLINKREAAFARLQRRLGAFEDPRAAWTAEFGELDGDRLWEELQTYGTSGQYVILQVAAPPWTGPIETRIMSDAEVHGVRAFMYVAVKPVGEAPQLDRARAEIAEALRADPAALEALGVQYYLLGEPSAAERSALASRASKAHPEGWLAWLMVADSAPFGDVRKSALAHALAIVPNQAEVLARMALLKASSGSWAQALLFSRKALRLRANGTGLLTVHVAALAYTGQCREAAFYATSWGGQTAADTARVQAAMNGVWLKLRDRCAREAADRASRDAEDDQPSGAQSAP